MENEAWKKHLKLAMAGIVIIAIGKSVGSIVISIVGIVLLAIGVIQGIRAYKKGEEANGK